MKLFITHNDENIMANVEPRKVLRNGQQTYKITSGKYYGLRVASVLTDGGVTTAQWRTTTTKRNTTAHACAGKLIIKTQAEEFDYDTDNEIELFDYDADEVVGLELV
jgi:hypothetical protein